MRHEFEVDIQQVGLHRVSVEITPVTSPPPPPPPPPAGLSVSLGPDFTSNQHDVTFNPVVTGGVPPYQFQYDYGDGLLGDSPSHNYAANGQYPVTVTVWDSSGGPFVQDSLILTVNHVHSETPPPPPEGRYYFTRHGDRLVDYCYQPTISSVRDGDALDPATWGGRVPNATDDAVFGHKITLAGALTVRNWKVAAGGELSVNSGTHLRYITGQVHEGARFVGSGKVRLAKFNGSLDTVYDPEQWGHGLNVTGEFVVNGPPKTPFMEVAEELRAGDTSIRFARPVVNWQAGDTIIIPDTRQLDYERGMPGTGGPVYQWQGEEVTVGTVAADGLSVTLVASLKYDHLGFRGRSNFVLDWLMAQTRWREAGFDSPDLRPVQFLFHVQNVTRDFVLESENPGGVRGHCVFTDMATVDLNGVEFRGLGRTTNEPIGPDNQIGRYPCHFHHLHGIAPRIRGCSVWNPGEDHNRKWGIVVHGTSNATVSDCALYNLAGSGINTEDGSERGCVIERNAVFRVTGAYGAAHPQFTGSDIAGAFWLVHPDNTVRDNVACGVLHGAGYYYFCKPLAAATVPIKEFSRNQVYGATTYGLSIWNLGMNSDQDDATQIGLSTIRDFFVANIHERGYYPYNASNVLIDGWVVRGDPSLFTPNTATASDEYAVKNHTFRNVDIQGVYAGASIGPVTWGTNAFEDVWFSDLGREAFGLTNLGVSTSTAVRAGDRRTVLRNVRYGPGVPAKLTLFWVAGGETKNNYTALDDLRLYQHGGDPGRNFRVYYRQQVAGEILPQTVQTEDGSFLVKGSPEAGLTNAQNWAKYMLATGGKVAPATAVDGLSDGVDGLLEPIAAEG